MEILSEQQEGPVPVFELPEQMPTEIYLNPKGHIVIKQGGGEDEFFVVIHPSFAPRLIKALKYLKKYAEEAENE